MYNIVQPTFLSQDGIVVAPSVLQHEVKNLSHNLLDKMVKHFTNLSGIPIRLDCIECYVL